MLFRLLSAALILAMSCAVVPAGDKGTRPTAQDENPYRAVKIGDYVNYKTSTKIGMLNVDGSMKQVVAGKDDKTATVKGTVSVLGQEVPVPATMVDLTKPFDPTSVINQGKAKADFKQHEKEKGAGKEKRTIGGKEYECTWIAGRIVTEQMGIRLDADVKVWFSKAIPLSGMARMEMKAEVQGMALETVAELSGFGNETKEKDK